MTCISGHCWGEEMVFPFTHFLFFGFQAQQNLQRRNSWSPSNHWSMDFLHSRYKVHHQSCRPSQDAAPMNWKVSKYSFAAQFLEKHFWHFCLTVTVWDFDLLDQCWIEDRRGETKARSNVSSPHWVKVENLHPVAWTAGPQEGCWCRELPFCEPDIFCISRKACCILLYGKTKRHEFANRFYCRLLVKQHPNALRATECQKARPRRNASFPVAAEHTGCPHNAPQRHWTSPISNLLSKDVFVCTKDCRSFPGIWRADICKFHGLWSFYQSRFIKPHSRAERRK